MTREEAIKAYGWEQTHGFGSLSSSGARSRKETDMDCKDSKKLIKQLKYYGITYAAGDNLGREIDGSDKMMLDAATAIETLLAERDAAVEELRGECRVCEHRGECLFNDQCGNGSNWQWRGPQKGAGDE